MKMVRNLFTRTIHFDNIKELFMQLSQPRMPLALLVSKILIILFHVNFYLQSRKQDKLDADSSMSINVVISCLYSYIKFSCLTKKTAVEFLCLTLS